MILFGISILIFFLLAFWRKLHHNYNALRFKYKVYSLRDHLRNLAIQEKIDSNHWLFDYYDNTFSKTISQHYYLTLFMLGVLVVRYSNNKQLKDINAAVDSETKKIPELVKLRNKYIDELKNYIEEQHYVSVNFIIKPIIVPLIGATIAAKRFNEWVKKILIFPETSDSSRVSY